MATSPGATFANAGADLIGTLPSDRVQELLKLQKAAQKISSILDLDQLIDKIVNDIACSFGCAEINVFLHEPDQCEMVLAGVHGCSLHHKGHRLKVGKEGLVGYVAATGQMRYAPDVSVDPYYIACEADTRSEVAIPLAECNGAGNQQCETGAPVHRQIDPMMRGALEGLANEVIHRPLRRFMHKYSMKNGIPGIGKPMACALGDRALNRTACLPAICQRVCEKSARCDA